MEHCFGCFDVLDPQKTSIKNPQKTNRITAGFQRPFKKNLLCLKFPSGSVVGGYPNPSLVKRMSGWIVDGQACRRAHHSPEKQGHQLVHRPRRQNEWQTLGVDRAERQGHRRHLCRDWARPPTPICGPHTPNTHQRLYRHTKRNRVVWGLWDGHRDRHK